MVKKPARLVRKERKKKKEAARVVVQHGSDSDSEDDKHQERVTRRRLVRRAKEAPEAPPNAVVPGLGELPESPHMDWSGMYDQGGEGFVAPAIVSQQSRALLYAESDAGSEAPPPALALVVKPQPQDPELDEPPPLIQLRSVSQRSLPGAAAAEGLGPETGLAQDELSELQAALGFEPDSPAPRPPPLLRQKSRRGENLLRQASQRSLRLSLAAGPTPPELSGYLQRQPSSALHAVLGTTPEAGEPAEAAAPAEKAESAVTGTSGTSGNKPGQSSDTTSDAADGDGDENTILDQIDEADLPPGSLMTKCLLVIWFAQVTSLLLEVEVPWTPNLRAITWGMQFSRTFAELPFVVAYDVLLPGSHVALVDSIHAYGARLALYWLVWAVWMRTWTFHNYSDGEAVAEFRRTYITRTGARLPMTPAERRTLRRTVYAVAPVSLAGGVRIAAGDADEGLAIVIGGSAIALTLAGLYWAVLHWVRRYHAHEERHFSPDTMILKQLKRTLSLACMFLVLVLYVPVCEVVFGAMCTVYDWDTSAERVGGRFGRVHHTPCYLLSFPPVVFPATNETVTIVDCASPSGMLTMTVSFMQLFLAVVACPLALGYLTWLTRRVMVDNLWLSDYAYIQTQYRKSRKKSTLGFFSRVLFSVRSVLLCGRGGGGGAKDMQAARRKKARAKAAARAKRRKARAKARSSSSAKRGKKKGKKGDEEEPPPPPGETDGSSSSSSSDGDDDDDDEDDHGLTKKFRRYSYVTQMRYLKEQGLTGMKLMGVISGIDEDWRRRARGALLLARQHFRQSNTVVTTRFGLHVDTNPMIDMQYSYRDAMVYWLVPTVLDKMLLTLVLVGMRVLNEPLATLALTLLAAAALQLLQLTFKPFVDRRETQLDSALRLWFMFLVVCGIALKTEAFPAEAVDAILTLGFMLLGALTVFAFNVPQLTRRAVRALEEIRDRKVCDLVYSLMTEKTFVMKEVATGLPALFLWDKLIAGKVRVPNRFTVADKATLTWAYVRGMRASKIRTRSGMSLLHVAVVLHEAEVVQWLVDQDSTGELFAMLNDEQDTATVLALRQLVDRMMTIERCVAAGEAIPRELHYMRSRFAEILLSGPFQSQTPVWDERYFAAFREGGLRGELTQQLAMAFNLNPPPGYARISEWQRYEDVSRDFLAEMACTTNKSLDLQGCNLGQEGIATLASLGRALRLKITSTTVSSPDFPGGVISLVSLNLQNNAIRGDGAELLAAGLQRNRSLRQLDLSHNQLGARGGTAIGDALRRNKRLRALNLESNDLTPAGGMPVCNAFRWNTALTQLNLADNLLGPSVTWPTKLFERKVEGLAEPIARALSRSKSLTDVDVSQNMLGPAVGTQIGAALGASDVTALNVSRSAMFTSGTVELCSALEKVDQLTDLDLSYNRIDEGAGEALKNLFRRNQALKRLSLSHNQIGPVAGVVMIKYLDRHPKLHTLELAHNNLGPEVAVELATVLSKGDVKLRALDYRHNQMSRAFVDFTQEDPKGRSPGHYAMLTLCGALLRHTPDMRVLKFGGNHLDANALGVLLQHAQAMPTVEELDIGGEEVPRKYVRLLAMSTRHDVLTRLSLRHGELGHHVGERLSRVLLANQSLSDIDLEGNELGPAAGEVLAQGIRSKSTWVKLNLNENSLGEAAGALIGEALKQNTSLTWLGVASNDFGFVGGRAVASALGTASVTERPLDHNTSVTYLDLSDNGLGARGSLCVAAMLHVSASVRTIRLGDNGLDEPAVATLAQALMRPSTALQELDLRGNPLGDSLGAALREPLKWSVLLRELNVSECGLSGDAVVALSTALLGNRTITTLILSENPVGAGCVELAMALEKNMSITRLEANNIQMGPQAGQLLGEALERNPDSALLHLELAGENRNPLTNHLEGRGGLAFAKALFKNKSIRYVDLQSNDIGNEGVDAGLAFARAIEMNATLRHINVGDNRLGTRAGKAIATALHKNSAITSLDLSRNRLDIEAGVAIEYVVQRNTRIVACTVTASEMGQNTFQSIKAITQQRGDPW